jgi:hypothetical protein
VKHIVLLSLAIWTGSAFEANGRTRLAWLVFFGYGSSELTPIAINTIREFVATQVQSIPRECPLGAAVVGHIDSAEAADGRDVLGMVRAEMVARVIEEAGWPFGEVELVARGDRVPLLKSAPGASEPQNRRVEVTPVYHRGDGEIECRAIVDETKDAGMPIDYSCQVVLKSGVRCPYDSGTVPVARSPHT